mgnify:CR=1 FL=1
MQSKESAQSVKDLSNIIKINEAQIQDHLGEMVRLTVEETLNAMLDAEADELCNAKRYERNTRRTNGRAGHYPRSFHTKAGEIELQIPKLRYAKFETAIIERYKRREASVEEALMEMYLAGVSVRRVEDITEALWGMRVSAGTVSELNQKVYERIEAWRNEPITGAYAYIYLDGISLKRAWGGEVRNVAILVAVGVSEDGYRDILGVAEGCKEVQAYQQFWPDSCNDAYSGSFALAIPFKPPLVLADTDTSYEISFTESIIPEALNRRIISTAHSGRLLLAEQQAL